VSSSRKPLRGAAGVAGHGGGKSKVARWSSRKDLAAKALRKLAGPHVPASLTKLEQAVKRAHSAYEKTEAAQHQAQRTDAPIAEAVDDDPREDLADAA
jgi:hypothetical protein